MSCHKKEMKTLNYELIHDNNFSQICKYLKDNKITPMNIEAFKMFQNEHQNVSGTFFVDQLGT